MTTSRSRCVLWGTSRGTIAAILTAVSMVVRPALAAPPDIPAPSPTPAAEAADTQAVIVELSEPPAARRRGPAAGAQRARVRRRLAALDAQHRAARRLPARAAATLIRHEYGIVFNGFAAHLLPETIAALRADPDVVRVTPDTEMHALLDVSVPLIRAPELWSDFGYRGAGVTIAIIDTGVDYTHPDLGGCFGPGCKVIGGYDFINNDFDPADDNGHGTHCAGIAAGNGVLQGVAPDASILAYKVLGAGGSGATSIVIAGIERACDPNNDGDTSDHVAVISMSLGGGGDEDAPDSIAVDNATAIGVLSAVAAGNAGTYFTIGSPGMARTALTVGATDDTDAIASFSSRGPTWTQHLIKPEVTAPGVGICSARWDSAFSSTCIDSQHVLLSGTSMATPNVAGAAALLRGLRPSLGPLQIKAILQEAAVSLPLDISTAGAGRIDVRAAADVETVLSPAPLNLGFDQTTDATWERSATVTVTNLGSSSKTYTLTLSGFPTGVTSTVTPDTVTVPAGGSANVTVDVIVDHSQVPDSLLLPYVHSATLAADAGAEHRAILVGFGKVGPVSCPQYDLGNAFPVSTSGESGGLPNNYSGSCGGFTSGEASYRWTAPFTGVFSIDTYGTSSSFNSILYVRKDTCAGQQLMCNNETGESIDAQVSISLVEGQTVIIFVDGWKTGGHYQLHITEAPPVVCPLNDLGNLLPVSVSGSTVGGPFSMGGASCASGGNNAPDVTYRWTAPLSGTYAIDTLGSDFETMVYVRDGECFGRELACNGVVGHGLSKLKVTLTAGQTVVVVADGFQTGQGNYNLHIDIAPTPTPVPTSTPTVSPSPVPATTPGACPQQDLGNALPVTVTGSTVGAYNWNSGPCGGEGSADRSYRWTAPYAGTFAIDTFGSPLNTVLYVRSETCAGAVLACNDDAGGAYDSEPWTQSQVYVILGAGESVIVVVDGHASSAGSFQLNITQATSGTCPDHDLGSVLPVTLADSNIGQPDSMSGATCGASGAGGADVSYVWRAPATGTYVIDTSGTFDSVLYVRDQTCLGPELACNDTADTDPGEAKVTLSLTANQQVVIVVDSHGAQAGLFAVHINPFGTFAPTSTSTPLPSATPTPNPLTSTPTLSPTPTDSSTDTPLPSATATRTRTATLTPIATRTPTPTRTPPPCGNGVLDGYETCDDGNLVSGDGCNALCQLESRARSCQKTIAGASASFFAARLRALDNCRLRIERGTLSIDASACVGESVTATAIHGATTRLRSAVARACTDPLVGVLKACAATVDGLVTAGGTGCLPATHSAAGDALQAQWGRTLLPTETSARRCQTALSKAGRTYATGLVGAYRRCRTRINNGSLVLHPTDCGSETRTAKAIIKVGRRARSRVAGSCTDAVLAAIAPCANTVDGIITPAGDAGCLVAVGAAAVDEMLVAEYGTPSH